MSQTSVMEKMKLSYVTTPPPSPKRIVISLVRKPPHLVFCASPHIGFHSVVCEI